MALWQRNEGAPRRREKSTPPKTSQASGARARPSERLEALAGVKVYRWPGARARPAKNLQQSENKTSHDRRHRDEYSVSDIKEVVL